jgi:Protein of unknown function (DUF4254)
MSKSAHVIRWIVSTAVACGAAVLSFHVGSVVVLSSNPGLATIEFVGRVLLVPGVLISMAASGNAHIFPLWLTSVANFLFWLPACWLCGAVIIHIRERREIADGGPPVWAAGTALLLEADAMTNLHDQLIERWHANPGEPTAVGEADWLAAVARHHRANFDLWHIEDEARVPNATDADLAGVKRRVDQVNQQRNDLTEELDRKLLNWLDGKGLPKPQAPLNSESPGLIIDRLSILALKIYHTREEANREDAPAGHAERNRERLAILEQQRTDLAGCLDALWHDTLAGKRRFKLYRQLKMYNDPSLNPAIYGRSHSARKS